MNTLEYSENTIFTKDHICILRQKWPLRLGKGILALKKEGREWMADADHRQHYQVNGGSDGQSLGQHHMLIMRIIRDGLDPADQLSDGVKEIDKSGNCLCLNLLFGIWLTFYTQDYIFM